MCAAANLRSTTLALLLTLAAAPALAVGDPADRLRDPQQEATAQAIGRELRCMVCQNQSIEDSEADIARDLRRLVRERVAAGADPATITREVHARYGDFVLLRPPFGLSTVLLWGAPAVVLLGAAAIALGRRRRGASLAPDGLQPEGLAPAGLSPTERARLARIEGDHAA